MNSGVLSVVETSALVNSSFEVDVPQLVLLVALVHELGFDIEEAPIEPITVCRGVLIVEEAFGVL